MPLSHSPVGYQTTNGAETEPDGHHAPGAGRLGQSPRERHSVGWLGRWPRCQASGSDATAEQAGQRPGSSPAASYRRRGAPAGGTYCSRGAPLSLPGLCTSVSLRQGRLQSLGLVRESSSGGPLQVTRGWGSNRFSGSKSKACC